MRTYLETMEVLIELLGMKEDDARFALIKFADPMLTGQYEICQGSVTDRRELVREYRRIQAEKYQKSIEEDTPEDTSDERCLQVCRSFIEHMARQDPKKREAVVPGFAATGPQIGLLLLEDDPQGDPGQRPVAVTDAAPGVPEKGSSGRAKVPRKP